MGAGLYEKDNRLDIYPFTNRIGFWNSAGFWICWIRYKGYACFFISVLRWTWFGWFIVLGVFLFNTPWTKDVGTRNKGDKMTIVIAFDNTWAVRVDIFDRTFGICLGFVAIHLFLADFSAVVGIHEEKK